MTVISPLPNLLTLVVYDIDPLCYPDDISLLLAGSPKLENLKLHWNPRMRRAGEESVNLLAIFGRCVAARKVLRIKRMAIYNLYTRFAGDSISDVIDTSVQREITVINSMGTSDPMTVFLDSAWKLHPEPPIPPNLKMMCTDNTDKEGAVMLSKFKGLEELYFVNPRASHSTPSGTNSTAATPTTPSSGTLGCSNGTPVITESQCRSVGGQFLAAIQRNHYTLRRLLLPDRWVLSDDALFKLIQSCPNLEQLGFASAVPPLESLRQVLAMAPKLWALRLLLRSKDGAVDTVFSGDPEMHIFALATESWKPEYKNIKYMGIGEDIIFKLGGVYFPPKGGEKIPEGQENSMNARRAGPIRRVEAVNRESVKHIEIWGMDTTDFDPKFP